MAETYSNNNGAFNDTTEVTIVDAPSSGVRLVKCITVQNKDTVDATVTIRMEDTGTDRQICKITLSPDDTLVLDEVYILDANDEYIKGVLSASGTTAQPEFTASYLTIT